MIQRSVNTGSTVHVYSKESVEEGEGQLVMGVALAASMPYVFTCKLYMYCSVCALCLCTVLYIVLVSLLRVLSLANTYL